MNRIGQVTYENRVFIHNLSFDVTEDQLKDYFTSKNVDVVSVDLLNNPKMNKPSGAAYWSRFFSLWFLGVFSLLKRFWHISETRRDLMRWTLCCAGEGDNRSC